MCGLPLESKAIDVSLSQAGSMVVMCHDGIGVGVGIEVAEGLDVGVGLSMGCVVGDGVAVAVAIFGVEEGETLGKVVIGSTGLGAVKKRSEMSSTVTIMPVEITSTFLFEKELFSSRIAGILTSWGSQPRILFSNLSLRLMLSARG